MKYTPEKITWTHGHQLNSACNDKNPCNPQHSKGSSPGDRDTGSTAVMEAEEDEPDTDAAYRSAAALKPKTLNEDPYNATWMKQYTPEI